MRNGGGQEMNTQAELVVHKTAKPIAAGIISIIVGSGCLLAVLGLGITAAVIAPIFSDFPVHAPLLIGILALIPASFGIVSIVGGIFALQRRMWGWALAGSITTICLSTVLGIVSLVLNVLSKDEFV
jgi:hypothetical protein